MAEPLRLHLGCGRQRMEGWVNCDLTPAPHVDEAFDAQKDWPFAADSASAIYASHLLEHLADPHAFFREAWRVLRTNGTMTLRVPYGGHGAAWWDLHHVRPWFPQTFAFLQPGYAAAIGNPQSDDWTAFFGIASIDQRLSGKFARLLRWRPVRRYFAAFADNIPNAIEEVWARLYALKTPQAVAEYSRHHVANCVPCRLVIYRHHWETREFVAGGDTEVLMPLAELELVHGFHAWRW